jgi:hypothetical protein
MTWAFTKDFKSKSTPSTMTYFMPVVFTMSVDKI